MIPVHHRYLTVGGQNLFYRRAGAEIHLLDGGHFPLQSHLDTAAGYIRGFLGRTLS